MTHRKASAHQLSAAPAASPFTYGADANIWYDFSDADYLTLDGVRIQNITNKADTDQVLTSSGATVANWTALVADAQNGLSAANPGAALSNQVMVGNIAIDPVNTILCVYKFVATSASQVIVHNQDSVGELNGVRVFTTQLFPTSASSTNVDFPGAAEASIVVQINGATTSTPTNGAWEVVGMRAGTGARLSTNIGRLFNGTNAQRIWSGMVGEVWGWESRLSDENLAAATAALMEKWGIE